MYAHEPKRAIVMVQAIIRCPSKANKQASKRGRKGHLLFKPDSMAEDDDKEQKRCIRNIASFVPLKH